MLGVMESRTEVSYSADVSERDQWVHDLAAGKETVQVRLQPTFYDKGNYRAWPGVSWLVTLPTGDAAIELRETLKAFFAAVGRTSLADVRRVLEGV